MSPANTTFQPFIPKKLFEASARQLNDVEILLNLSYLKKVESQIPFAELLVDTPLIIMELLDYFLLKIDI